MMWTRRLAALALLAGLAMLRYRPHWFTEALPREEARRGDCEFCERDVGFHEGPHAARKCVPTRRPASCASRGMVRW